MKFNFYMLLDIEAKNMQLFIYCTNVQFSTSLPLVKAKSEHFVAVGYFVIFIVQ